MDVKAIRQQLNLTQWELAKITGIPRDRIAKWEQGKGIPKAEDQKVIGKLIGKKVTENAPRLTETAQNGHKSQKTVLDKPKDKLTTMTTKPSFEMQPTNGNPQTKDAIIKTLADTTKNQQDTIGKLTDLVTKLIEKK